MTEPVHLLEATGVTVANPHTYVLEEGHGATIEPLLEAKRRNDPSGLLKTNWSPSRRPSSRYSPSPCTWLGPSRRSFDTRP